MRPGLAVSDYISGMFACIGVMMALYNRDVVGTGKGQMIDVGLYESIFRIIESTVVDYVMFGDIRQRVANGHPLSVPGNHYITNDGKWVTIASANDAVFKRLCEAVGCTEFLVNERYNNQQERTKPENKAVIDKYFEDWFKAHTEEECKAILEKEVPYSAILSIDQIMKEEHVQARGNIVKVVQDKVGEITMQGVVPHLSNTPGKVNWAGASLGAFNDEIYKSRLGFSDEKIAELKAAGII
jgi:crotonobetainyl-CoA:carnitine CoA-transferase CaiB-like acyl-CoA transferase